jgi:Fe-S cluster biogenesis protein NfuA
MANSLSVFYESTPNPNSMKFRVDHQIANESVFFDEPAKASRSPLAQKLFGFPWAQAVFVGPDFVTVTKQSWVDWSVIADPLANLIAEHIERNEGVLLPAQAAPTTTQADPNDSPIVQKIKEILETEIRPAVAIDGGDIVFNRYEDNRLYLHMQGACAGCPSSAMTLKDGIETRMKAAVPELIEVISV